MRARFTAGAPGPPPAAEDGSIAEQDRKTSPATSPRVDSEPAGGEWQPTWATLRRSLGQPSDHVKGCRCCFPPDQMFEDACCAIVALDVPGIGSLQAEKFVRLCGGGIGSMTLSKGKAKTAQKLRRGMPLSPAEVASMQGHKSCLRGVDSSLLSLACGAYKCGIQLSQHSG